MKTTGMVRRVDSLGRIVIPKEIRKVLRIKENEQVEINVSGNEIVLNRYSELDDKDLFLENLINIIKEVYDLDILITNLNNFTLTTNRYLYLLKNLFKIIYSTSVSYILLIKKLHPKGRSYRVTTLFHIFLCLITFNEVTRINICSKTIFHF